jgi:hypothetical protein
MFVESCKEIKECPRLGDSSHFWINIITFGTIHHPHSQVEERNYSAEVATSR